MTAPGLGYAVVDAPVLLPPANGLLNSATVIDSDDERFAAGESFEPESLADLLVFNVCNEMSVGDVVLTVADVVTTAGNAGITSASAMFNTDDVGKSVTSTTVGNQSFSDGQTTGLSSNLTSPSAGFTSDDIGKTVSGTNIPGGTTITSITNPTVAVMSNVAMGSGSGQTFTIANRKAIVPTATIVSVANSSSATLSAPAKITASGVNLTIVGRRDGPNRNDPLSFTPFGVQAKDTCFSRGFQTNEYEARARRALAARETIGVEYEFWTGAADSSNRHLAEDGSTKKVRSGTALGLRTSLAALVQAIADYKLGAGMIHARPGLVTAWSALNLLNWRNGKLYTLTGVLVVPGSGYPGTGPNNEAVSITSEWAYATEAVTVKRGRVEVFTRPGVTSDNLNKVRNLVTSRAVRLYSVQFNAAAIVAAQVDPTSTS